MSKEKVKKENKFMKKIREMKKTPKGKAALKLIGYGIFFFILFIIMIIGSMLPQTEKVNPELNNDNTVTDNKENKESVIEKLQKDLLTKDFDYKYEITIGENKYTFEGNKNSEINTGYKTTSAGIIKYYIDTTGIYQELNGEKTLIDNLYENIEQNYLDLNYLFDILKPEKLTEIPCDCLYDIYGYNDNINNYEIIFANHLEENDNYISEITIKNDNYSYKLSYRNVGIN